jgi:GTPase
MKRNIPKIAIVGKPNVGKSTLINRICSSTEAIVHKQPMITRDRKYYNSDWNGVEFYILDTGGIDLKSDERLSSQIFLQTEKAIEESDLIIFLVDLKEPLSPLDEEIANILRKTEKPIIFTGNKWDSDKSSYFTEDYLKLGFGYPVCVSAIQGLNMGDLLDEIVSGIKKLEKSIVPEDEIDENIPNISILGQPNVGKSTLFNKIIKEDRVIVDEVEGTTRDTIDSIISVGNDKFKFIDTAGLKKNKLKEEELEYYSKIRTIKAIEKSDVCLILIDATREITNQDLKIVELCLEKGTSVCIIFNKVDLVNNDLLQKLILDLDKELKFARFIPFLKISALKDIGINEIFGMIISNIEERNKKISDNKLIELFKELEQESAIYWKERKFKIKFIKQIKTSPPLFFVFSNMDINKKTNIKRFIENNIREKFGFIGTPLFFKYKY